GSASLDAVMAAHALLGRACDRLGDRKCAEKEYAVVLSLWQARGGGGAKLDALGADDAARMPRVARALLAAGEALFFFAEQKRSEAEKVTMPAYGGSGSREDVLKHLNTKVGPWLKQKRSLLEETENAYVKIVELQPVPPPRWVIDAAARVGGMWDRFVTAFRATPMPKEWNRSGPIPEAQGLTYEELRNEYRAQITLASEPLMA